MAPPPIPPSNRSAKAMKRYWSAYLVARATASIGGAIKIFAILSGITVAVIGLYVGQQGYGSPNSFFQYGGSFVDPTIFQFGALVVGVIVIIPPYIVGVLVTAHGQVLKASLDEAVHTSPFLTDDQRAAVMSL
jgi:hypothetical protein